MKPAWDDQWVVIDCNFVNLRETPHVSAKSLMQISVGSTVKWLGWEWKFARVRYNGKTGYIMASYLAPGNNTFMKSALDTVIVTETYTYTQMMEDLIAFDLAYPELVDLEVIGLSTMKKEIPVIRIGNVKAEHHVLIHGSIHGREHATTWLLMALIDYGLDWSLGAYSDVCFHIIPMVNPDGVTISQTGKLPEELVDIYNNDLKKGYTTLSMEAYARNWKANGRGVDLNRNFPAGWETITERTSPSSERYRGTEPFSEPEAKMLRDYTQRYSFDVTVSYHAMGSVIYYEYGQKSNANTQGLSLARAVYGVTGYSLLGSTDVDGAGYKDWAIADKNIPSLTIEIGSQNAPLVKRELYSIFVRNLNVFSTIAQWIRK